MAQFKMIIGILFIVSAFACIITSFWLCNDDTFFRWMLTDVFVTFCILPVVDFLILGSKQ